ncbi:hypothetical protein E2542_SST16165 [Spatholobus suberectus]|nr:hypothetical protein E2542_SST16165 [Spatholobus suberectus]
MQLQSAKLETGGVNASLLLTSCGSFQERTRSTTDVSTTCTIVIIAIPTTIVVPVSTLVEWFGVALSHGELYYLLVATILAKTLQRPRKCIFQNQSTNSANLGLSVGWPDRISLRNRNLCNQKISCNPF